MPAAASQFLGDSALTQQVRELETPYQFFKYFFTDEILETICEETTRYSVQVDPSKPCQLSLADLKKYIGICTFMSVVHLPNCRDYWHPVIGNQCVIDTMSINSYENIRKNLHFNNNDNIVPREDVGHDRLHKIRPVLEGLRQRCLSIPMEECLSLDEQICSTKARHFLKQYLPNKPHKWGYKLWVLSGVSGFAYDIEIFSGQENDDRQPGEDDLGASSNVVVRLSRNVPKYVNHKLYFDNYFTSVPLLVYLKTNGIYSLGTVRRNRIPDCKLPKDDVIKKSLRGYSEEFVSSVDDVTLSNVIWKDNKAVTLLSTLAGVHPTTQVKRYDRKLKTKIDVDCPNVIKMYNKHMGGVDLLDSIMGRHKIGIRSKKWYFRLFYHLLDLSIVNAWLLYRRVEGDKGVSIRTMTLGDFRIELATSLCKMGLPPIRRGRPSNDLEIELQAKKRKGPAVPVPPRDVRQDQQAHWPRWLEKRQRCKLPGCSGYTWTECSKCKVGLCYHKNANCFTSFHLN